MVGGFELAGRLVMGIRAVVKAAVGERAAEPFVKEQEEQGDLNPFWSEPVDVAGSVTLQQPVGFELAQVVAELVEPVGAIGEVEGGEDGVVDLLGGPAADLTTAVQEDLEEADDTGVVDLDSGIWTLSHCAWKPAKRLVMVWNRSRTASRWSNPFLRWKSARLLETSSLRRKVANFSYCFRNACLSGRGRRDGRARCDR